MLNFITSTNSTEYKNIYGQNLHFFIITQIYHCKKMNVNLCDRTSISNITILDEKDRKAFQYRRIAHKMTHIKKLILREKNESKAERSQFESMQEKFGQLAQTASSTILKCEQIKKTLQYENKNKTSQNPVKVKKTIKSSQQSNQNRTDSQSDSSKNEINQKNLKGSSNKKEEERKNFEMKSRFGESKKIQILEQKRVKKGLAIYLKSKGITTQHIWCAFIFSMMICFLARCLLDF